MCATICPEGVVEGDLKNTFVCDYDYCKGCGLCAALCPKQDIQMVPEGEKI
jgi:pyruvate ferredoxin oxidoreductase delta subunit